MKASHPIIITLLSLTTTKYHPVSICQGSNSFFHCWTTLREYDGMNRKTNDDDDRKFLNKSSSGLFYIIE
jgi:hypothetical protein